MVIQFFTGHRKKLQFKSVQVLPFLQCRDYRWYAISVRSMLHWEARVLRLFQSAINIFSLNLIFVSTSAALQIFPLMKMAAAKLSTSAHVIWFLITMLQKRICRSMRTADWLRVET